jgi:PIN domain nuclease of toxin-antitoxin system
MLLDTHTLIWFLNDDTKLSGNTKAIIEDGDNLFVSIISIWEIAIKINVGNTS